MIRAPDFMFEHRLYDGYRLRLGEGATSVLMDDDSLKNVISNRDPLDSEKFMMFLTHDQKREFDRWFEQDIRRSDFFIYEPVFQPNPSGERFYVLGRIRGPSILGQRLIRPELNNGANWEIEIEVEFNSRKPLLAPLSMYPLDPTIEVTGLIHVPENHRTQFTAEYTDPRPLDWRGFVQAEPLRDTTVPEFKIPNINDDSMLIIRYRTSLELQGKTSEDDPTISPGTDGLYRFSGLGLIFYKTAGSGASYVSVFENGAWQPREEIWQRRGTAQVDSGDLLPPGNGWAEAQNPAILNQLGTIRQSAVRLRDLHVLLINRLLTENEMDEYIARQPDFI